MAGIVRQGRLHHPLAARRGGRLLAALMAASVLALGAPGSAGAASKQASAGAKAKDKPRAAASASKSKGKTTTAARADTKTANNTTTPRGARKAAIAAAAVGASAATAAGLGQATGAEARLIAVYERFGRGEAREALEKARELVRDHPNFQLAQLVYADLLATQVPPSHAFSDATSTGRLRADPAMAELREESRRRLQALRERPPPGTVPSQFLALSTRSRYAIAVDASRSRLYLLENSADKGLQLVADYYVSIGKAGIGKVSEGDARTPLGVYYVTSRLDPKSLKDFYGAGALPINYPNPYDVRRGKTGSGIWLHGTPPQQFARAPLASDGCVVMANPDLKQLLRKVQVGATPVVTASRLQWIPRPQAEKEAEAFNQAIAGWKDARAQGNEAQLKKFYLPDFQRSGKKANEANSVFEDEVAYAQGKRVQLKDTSFLHWREGDDTMVATFGEVFEGEKSGRTRRQYWLRQGGEWKLFHEEILG